MSATGFAAATVAKSEAKAPKHRPGYKKKNKGGEVVYCKNDAVLGTRLSEEMCFSEAELDEIERRNEQVNSELRQNMGRHICGNNCSR